MLLEREVLFLNPVTKDKLEIEAGYCGQRPQKCEFKTLYFEQVVVVKKFLYNVSNFGLQYFVLQEDSADVAALIIINGEFGRHRAPIGVIQVNHDFASADGEPVQDVVLSEVYFLNFVHVYEVQFQGYGLFRQREYEGLLPRQGFSCRYLLAALLVLCIGEPAED